ncbi:LRR receptor-like serine/threonine-protein kinase ERECTA isoform X3 [Coffea eugenioides]|uniref:LRR receptor-like serine/threonine-protein kinase ERECTA isoform X3 n=1 Tax=Coffea eugenioides TaxID=49369 RepID=UPI000F60CBFD|nr:LRR receptor-like serine/threonine-protein kinase ERECTA isoform X3 [Coffea eugenioides]
MELSSSNMKYICMLKGELQMILNLREIGPRINKPVALLLSIDLRGNRLSGQIPDEIGDCSALTSLDFSFNELYGDIPFSISKLKQLEFLILKNNQLIGPIPSTLSQIPNLKVLDLAQNSLSGEIPRLIYWNEVLQYLGLRGNKLVGTLSPNMCQLTGLWYFCLFSDVRNNSLTGSIPENIGNCTAFQVLDLSYNQLTGEIPFNIGFLQVDTFGTKRSSSSHTEGSLSKEKARKAATSRSSINQQESVEEVPVSCELLQNSDYNNQQPIVIEPLLQQNGKKGLIGNNVLLSNQLYNKIPMITFCLKSLLSQKAS